ncbi:MULTISPECIES: VWA domain-containing protein [unclassified Blastococcus]
MTPLRRAAAALAATAVLTGLTTLPAAAAPADPLPVGGTHPVLLLVDTSGSMGDPDANGTPKIEGAKAGLLAMLEQMPVDSEIGLRTYPAVPGACDGGREVIPVARRSPASMSAQIRTLSANGDTPTAEALAAAGESLLEAGFEEATIVVVSDGESTCADPCPVAAQLRSQGLDITIDTVGFALAADDPAVDQLSCLSDSTGGTYRPAEDAEELGERLAQFSAPTVEVDLATDTTFNPEAQSALTVTATVRNPSTQPALDVRVDLRFDGADAPDVSAPLKLLGNLPPGGSREVSWVVHTADGPAAGRLQYTVRATTGGAQPVEAEGLVELREGLDRADGGQLFADAEDVVVLGDDLSAGAGAGDESGDCLRSPNSYAAQLFGDGVTNLACADALLTAHADGQGEELTDLDAVDLVLLTAGDADLGLTGLVAGCLGEAGCDGEAVCTGTDVDCAEPTDVWAQRLGQLRPQLEAYYRRVLADAGEAPVVVLPYVAVVPRDVSAVAACAAALPDVSPDELARVGWVQAEANRQIAAAVDAVGSDRLLYAGEVEDALLPDHSLCEERPWVVSADAEEFAALPTAEGQTAIAGALLRWAARVDPPLVEASDPSGPLLGEVGETVGEVVGDVRDLVDDVVTDTPVIDLDDPSGSPVEVSAGRPVTVEGGGFAPRTKVRVVIAGKTVGIAEADADGNVKAQADVPADVKGGATVALVGLGKDGGYQLLAQAVTVGDRPLWGGLALALIGVLIALGGWQTLRVALARRRRPRVPAAA